MSGKSTKNAANNMVDLIRELIQQELIKEDNTATCRIMACNSDGSYDINVLPDMVTVIRSVKSISPENLKEGDYAYIFKFKNKLNNAVIITKIGGLGSDVRFLTARDENGNVVNISGGPFLPLTGGTLTGSLDITPDSASHKHVKVNAPSGSAYAELSTFTVSSTTRARLILNDGSGSPTEYRTKEIKIGDYTLSFPTLTVNKTIATTDFVSGSNDGTNWTSITIGGVTKAIPAAGSSDNQRIKTGSTTFGANDVIDIVGGSNVSVVGATSGTGAPKITISATDKYHTTGSWSGLTYTATNNGGAEALAFTIPTGTTSTTVALGNHTHSQYVVKNNDITGATKCKITYDSKGLVTGGADLTASDIPDLSATYLPKSGGTMSGAINMDNHNISGINILSFNGGPQAVASNGGIQFYLGTSQQTGDFYIPSDAQGTAATQEWVGAQGYSVVSGVNDGNNWTSITIDGVTKNIPDNNDNQTIKGNGTAFGANDAVDILGTSNLVTVTANTTNKTITINLADGYGDTKNPYASKTANYVLASPNGSAGAPTFRALVAADIPDLRGTYLPRAGGALYSMNGTLYVNGVDDVSLNPSISSASNIVLKTNNSYKTYINGGLVLGDPNMVGNSTITRQYAGLGHLNRTYTLPDASGVFVLDSNEQNISGLKTITNANGLAFSDGHTTGYIKSYSYGNGSDVPYESGLKLDARHIILAGNGTMGSGIVAVNDGSFYANGLSIGRGTNAVAFGLDTDSMTNNGFYFQGVSDSGSPRFQPNASGYGLRLPDTSSWTADKMVATTSDIGNGTLTIQGNGTPASTFTANQSGNTTLNIKGGGITSVTKTANDEITITSTEVDTLATVTARGATTTTAVTMSGGLDVTGNNLKLNKISAPTSSGGTTYGPGSNGQVLKSNGSTVYWATDTNSDTWRNVKVDTTEVLGTGTNTGSLTFLGQNTNYGDVTFTYDSGIKATAKMPTALKNPNAIKIQGGGADVASYDGSAAKTINFAASSTAGAFTISDGTTTRTIQLAGVFTDNNQTVKVGSTTFGANTAVNLVGEGAITVTADTTNGKITFSAPVVSDTNQKVKAGSVTFSDNDTVNFVGSGIVSVTGNASNDTITISASHQSIKSLDTTATTAQSTNSNEAIAGTGKITLHKVAKTGTYSYLIGKPSIPTKDSDLTNDRYVRFDTASQGLNNTQKQNARANINAGTPIEIVDLTVLA